MISIPTLILSVVLVSTGTLIFYIGGKFIWKKLREQENLKYEFITIIAHKFRTPLTQMKWLVEGLITDEQDSYKRQSLEDIGRSNQKLIDLTGSLIELADSDDASRSSYAFEPLNLCDLVKNISDTFKSTFHEKNLFLSVQCSTPEIWANVDRGRIEFVLQTLLQNASTYSPPGRNVEIAVSLEANKNGSKNALITVADHGIGIDPRDLGKIFTKFFRTAVAQKTDTEGFGVGLYLAQSVVRRHKGKIEVFSEGLDRGTTFVITLPTTDKVSVPKNQLSAS